MKKFLILAIVGACASTVMADLRMPKKDSFYDKFGRGFANIVLAPAEILDSTYELTMNEGPTVGLTKGLVQGTSRMVMDIGIGVAEIVTSPYSTGVLKRPAYDTQQIDLYPPADLIDNWY